MSHATLMQAAWTHAKTRFKSNPQKHFAYCLKLEWFNRTRHGFKAKPTLPISAQIHILKAKESLTSNERAYLAALEYRK